MGANKKNNGRPRVFPTTQLTQNGPSSAKVAAYHPPWEDLWSGAHVGVPQYGAKIKNGIGHGAHHR